MLAAWPRVCMGRPFNLKFDNIVWEDSPEKLQAWKDGRTGFPVVDAVRPLSVDALIVADDGCRRCVRSRSKATCTYVFSNAPSSHDLTP